jgi:hypothetical protein
MPLTEREQRLLTEIEAGLLRDHGGPGRRSRSVDSARQWPAIGILILLVAAYALSIQTGLTITIAAVLLGSIIRIHRRASPALPPSS